MPTRQRLRAAAICVALLPAAPLAAQPTLTDVTFWGSNAAGFWTSGSRTTRAGASYHIYLAIEPNATYTPAAVINPPGTLSRTLGVGTHELWFYNGAATQAFSGINVFFGGNVPHLSAVAMPGGSFAAIPPAVACTLDPLGNCIPGAGTLTYASAPYTVTLTAFEVLSRGDGSGARIDRVSPNVPAPDGFGDAHGRIVLQVTGPAATTAPEPATWTLLGAGLLGVAAVARRRARA